MTWADNDYGYKKRITIDKTKCTDETSFPVLISITDVDLKDTGNGGHVQSASGYDIVFYDSTETNLRYHEIQRYVNTTGQIIIWVNTDLSSTVDTVLYMYYGKAGVTVDPSSTDTWDANFIMVHHLNGADKDGCLDSTSNDNDVTGEGGSVDFQQTGKIGYGIGLVSASGEWLSIPDSVSLDLADGNFTLEAWVNYGEVHTALYVPMVSKWDTGADKRAYTMYGYNGTLRHVGIVTENGDWTADERSSAEELSVLLVDDWRYYAATFPETGETIDLYQDGIDNNASDTYHTASSIYNSDRPLYIGCHENSGTPYRFWTGFIDEVRISKTKRSVNWLLTCHKTQDSPSTFMGWSGEISKFNVTVHIAGGRIGG